MGPPTKAFCEQATKLLTLGHISFDGKVLGKRLHALTSLQNLEDVDLQGSHTSIDEETFMVLSRLNALKDLSVHNANFPGSAPKHLSNLKHLKDFSAFNTD